MYDVIAVPAPPVPSTIEVQARDGWNIPNGRVADPDPTAVAVTEQQIQLIFPEAIKVAPATGWYNCHGLTFATRRTFVPPWGTPIGNLVESILQRDGYVALGTAPPRVGDVAVYRDPQTHEVSHTGYVSRVTGGTIWVWSKWGTLAEYEHPAGVGLYGAPEFWRLAT